MAACILPMDIDTDAENFIGALKEYCDTKRWTQPEYDCTFSGPDHCRAYVATVQVNGRTYRGEGESTLKTAKHSAAKAALTALHSGTRSRFRLLGARSPMVYGASSGSIGSRNHIGRLKELCDQLAVSWRCDDIKDIKRVGGSDHCPRFRAKMTVNGEVFFGHGTKKTTAKQKAAELALEGMSDWVQKKPKEYVSEVDSEELEVQSPSAQVEIQVVNNPKEMDPRSKLNELCQKFCIFPLPEPKLSRSIGPPFTACIVIKGKKFYGQKSSKQDAIQMASLNACHWLIDDLKQPISDSLIKLNLMAAAEEGDVTFTNQVAQQCHGLYDQLCRNALYPQSSADVIAAVIQLCTDTGDAQIVAMGSGSKCINGHNLSDNGTAVQDCHAEVVARRAFMRYLYSQARSTLRQSGADESIFEEPEHGKLKVKSSILFLLYISKPPCGDATQFTRADTGGRRDPTKDGACQPYWNPTSRKERKMGVLRKKLESGEGGVVLSSHTGVQSWAKLKYSGSVLSSASPDERLATMSCSDKILKWNTLGLQGALLSRIMEPVYLSAVVIGDGELFHHGHIARGICCRFRASGSSQHHPSLHVVSGPVKRKTYTDKVTDVSLNWFVGCEGNRPEWVVPTTGRTNCLGQSRICKRKLYACFQDYCDATGRRLVRQASYSKAKSSSLDYTKRKIDFYEELRKRGFGNWVSKPHEVDNFCLQ